jgi:hypothetical protein
MLAENFQELKRLSNRTVYLNTVMKSLIGYKTKKIMDISKHFQFSQL